MMRKLYPVLALCFLFAATKLAAANTNTVLNGWLAAQAGVQTWSADFVQTRQLKNFNKPLTAKGKLWFAAPNRFRWELGNPPQTIALRQADAMWVIYPLLKRAERYPITDTTGPARDALALIEAGFPQTRADIDRQFRILNLTQTNSNWRISMTPNSSQARRFLSEISVTLSTNSYSLVATELVFAEGSKVRNDFTNVLVNPPIDEQLFEPKLPRGTTITQPLSK